MIYATKKSVALVASLALCGCGAGTQVGVGDGEGSSTVSATDDGSTPPAAPAPSASRPTAETTSAEPLGAQQMVEVATQDLADRLGVQPQAITVARNDSVTWPDGSLGCPQPGMAYISMLSPGRLIVLEAGGETYEYHAGRRMAPFLCEDPQPPIPG